MIAGYGFDSGMAPGAFLAIYKALWLVVSGGTGSYVDILAAVDQAVADGCDIISLSLGGSYSSYFDDVSYLRAAKVLCHNMPPPPSPLPSSTCTFSYVKRRCKLEGDCMALCPYLCDHTPRVPD